MTPKTKPRDGVLRGGPALAIRLLFLAAALISAYLLSVSLSGGSAVGCAPGSSCDAVLKSRWGYFLGVPVSLFAILVDGALLLTTFSCSVRSNPAQRRKAWEIMIPGALLVLGAVLWFVAIQAIVLQRYCPWCMASHTCASVGAILLLLRAPMREPADKRDKESAVSPGKVAKLAAVSLALVAVLGVAQIAVAPKTYQVTTIAAATTNAAPATAITPLATNTPNVSATTSTNANVATTPPPVAPKPAGEMFGVFGGVVNVDLAQAPLWGSPKAPFKMVSLHDYSCHHCAEMHSRIAEVYRAFSNSVAVLSLPMPLDGKCNPAIPRTPPAHVNACEYARIGLAVWRARPQALAYFEDWFFEEFHRANKPPTVDAARSRAAELAGGIVALDVALRDPWVEMQIGQSIAIFRTSMTQFKNASMPQFIIGTNLVSGMLSTAQLSNLVRQYVQPN
jgi:uncharacterized membrane protein/protein-disulfide isomerase